MKNPKRFKVSLCLLLLLAVSLGATAEMTDVAEKKRATLDPRLQRFLLTPPSERPKLWRKIKKYVTSRRPSILSATTISPPQPLPELAAFWALALRSPFRLTLAPDNP